MGGNGVDESTGVDLASAIEAVRAGLVEAQRAGQGKPLSFAVGKVEIEFGGEVKTVVGGGGGVKFWVVSVDGKGERSSAATHKVRVELTPQDAEGRSWRVAGNTNAPPAR
ncbi:hypothetical protein SAMN05192558_103313 [Actinokineospora alba]|uniref:Trypsin-co-occurring domain-containing protein n=1 Tax=Actinokineospora alba TaxID=504798 RepID=A0A1H0K2X2_9PSEU|nr:trypco2 family protein [Actinokineospora alba]TDP68068.1 hypothetical protein C8E96_3629 [Actinokineospora alba]SDH91815.1 hypothetical protein SAMN05421871_102736 [Actinokineospora alba]SDO50234.1 hypothetical protein SAMN05192558_103313 [Actinokineospora alba]